jgi:hypothetical protein
LLVEPVKSLHSLDNLVNVSLARVKEQRGLLNGNQMTKILLGILQPADILTKRFNLLKDRVKMGIVSNLIN